MMKLMRFACFMIVFLVVPFVAQAEEMHRLTSDVVNVQYPGPLGNVAREVIRLYPSVKKELEDLFQVNITFTPTITLIKDRDDFQNIVGHAPVVALAVSGEDHIIIDNSRMKTYPFTLKVTLKHEVCHLVLHHIAGDGQLPRWFNEGIAQWTSDGIAEIIVGERKDLLGQAVLSKHLVPLGSLDTSLPADEHSLILAYQQSQSVINFISSEYGADAVVRTLKHVRNDCDIDCALRKGIGLSLFELEQKWHASLERKVTWFTYMSAYLYQILFIFAALVLTGGFIRMMLMKRSYKDDEEDIS
ncbi:MAG: hypothetical protein HZC49_14125 [Nitrospirae bacterium]|nr:hypothetical protein [Nitrospirota bacterium]